jgi:hypothetical protein
MELVKIALRNNREAFYETYLQSQIDEAAKFADSIGKRDNFEDALARACFPTFFGRKARTLLHSDFAPYSFGFIVQVYKDVSWKPAMNGGIIFHHSCQEWSVHT